MKPEDTAEWHSTDLTDHCPARVKLRLQGKISNRAPTAMIRGMLAGSALEYLHAHKTSHWGGEDVPVWKAIDYAAYALREDMEKDNRIITDAAETALKAELPDELEVVLEAYIRRLGPLFAQTEHIGAEVPIRCSYPNGEGSTLDFASHLDLVIHDKDNVFGCRGEREVGPGIGLTVFDWKWRKDTPSKAYLARNQQFLLYWLACKHGKVFFQKEDVWFSLNEHPGMAWIHLPSLKPYTRKVITKDDDGIQREFKKGDDRPIRQVVRVVRFEPSQADNAAKALCKKVEMYKKGYWPQNPDPVGCGICEAEDFCTRYDTVQLEGDD